MSPHHIVVIGGGFGGLHAVRGLRRQPVLVTLIDRRNFHLFQPLLYQVATGALSPANIAAPLRKIFSRQKNCRVVLGDVTRFDLAERTVHIGTARIAYDTLVVAAGSGHSYFGHDDWERFAPGLKTVEDATEIRAKILTAFEAAELADTPEERAAWLTFVVVGGGPTGVELAGALAEIARHSLRHDFRHIDPGSAHILLIEAGPRLLATFPEELSQRAEAELKRLGVTVRTGTSVTDIAADSVTLKRGDKKETLSTRTILWAAGVKASPLAKSLADQIGAEPDRAGRIPVQPDLTLPGHPEVFVIGDMARYDHGLAQPLPGVAPVAIQQGKFVARTIAARLRQAPSPEFHYRDRGNLATIGRSAAVADFGRLRLSGWLAWVLWLVVHLLNIVSFRNRLLVLVQWSWNYLTWDRSARLITGTARSPQRGSSL